MLVRAEIEGDMSVPCSGKGCPKSPKSDDETTDEIEARTDADETTEDEIVSIKSCKGKHCKKNTTSIEEDGVEEKKHGKGKKIDEDELGDAEVRAEGAAADTPVAEVKVKKCKGKKCEQDVQEIANLAEAGVAEAVAVATEEPSKVSKISSDETEVRTEGATDIAEVKGKKHQEEIANLAEAGVAEAVAMATEEPSKVSKISSDETEVSTIVCGSHHLLLIQLIRKEISYPFICIFLVLNIVFANCAIFFNIRILRKLLLPMLVISPRLLLSVRARSTETM